MRILLFLSLIIISANSSANNQTVDFDLERKILSYAGLEFQLFFPSSKTADLILQDSSRARDEDVFAIFAQLVLQKDGSVKNRAGEIVNTDFTLLNSIVPSVPKCDQNNQGGKAVASIAVKLGNVELPSAVLNACSGKLDFRLPDEVVFLNMTYSFIPLDSEIISRMQAAEYGSIEVSGSQVDAFNSQGKIRWDASRLSAYLSEITVARGGRNNAANQFENDVLAYRSNPDNFPSEIRNVSLLEFDNNAIPRWNFQYADQVCYKALAPYYASKKIADISSAKADSMSSRFEGYFPEGSLEGVTNTGVSKTCGHLKEMTPDIDRLGTQYSHKLSRIVKLYKGKQYTRERANQKLQALYQADIQSYCSVSNVAKIDFTKYGLSNAGALINGRCIDAKKVADDRKKSCSNSNSLSSNKVDCDCVWGKTHDFWVESNLAERPASFSSKSNNPRIGQRLLECKAN